ncbi:Pkinase-domain-containing protein [Serendipita vermifera]|nr:Pkinase-domain-containing protein [Serendipita vermifera]
MSGPSQTASKPTRHAAQIIGNNPSPPSSPHTHPVVPRSKSQSSSKPVSPNSDASSGDSSIDEEFENRLAARQHYRVLDKKLDELRQAFRKDPINQALSDYDLNQGAKAVELEDEDERELYKELRNYVVRDGKLGINWEKYLASQKTTNRALRLTDDEHEEGGLDGPAVEADHVGNEDGPSDNGDYQISDQHDIEEADSPAVDFIEQSKGHDRISQSNLVTDGNEEEDVPLARGRFENLALNDTLQLRHQQLHQSHDIPPTSGREESTLPPSAIIYDPPPPRVVKLKKETVPDLGRGGMRATSHEREKQSFNKPEDRRRLPPTSSSNDLSLNQQTTKSKSKMASSQTPRGLVQSSAQQRLNRSTGKRRFDDIDSAVPSSADERATGAVQPPRPGSSRSLRGDHEVARNSLEIDTDPGTLRPSSGQMQAMQQRPNYHQQPSYSDYRQQPYTGFQQDPNERMHSMQMQRSGPPGMGGGAPYYGTGNDYVPQGQGSSPIEQSRGIYSNGMGIHSASTPGYTMEGHGLMRTSSMPTGDRARGPLPPSHMGGADGSRTMIKVNNHQYQRLEQIGRGGSSKVYRVIRQNDSKQFALKKVVLSATDDEAMRSYTAEINMLKRLSGNQCIVRLVDDELKGKGSGTLYLVMELGETDFARLLVERQKKPIYLPWITMYFKQMLDAVNVIHEERIVHSDLKPANFVLIRGMLKLIDFGIAKAIANDTTNIQRDSQVGTLNYMSPETMNAAPGDDRLKIGRPSDVWSLGCILYQMVYGAAPFASLNMQQKMLAIAREDYAISFPQYSVPVEPKETSGTGRPEPREDLKVKVPLELIQTMKACLQRDAKKRPTISQLLKEPWLNGFYGNDSAPRNEEVQQLAEDEAIISSLNMWQLINHCLRTHDPTWDEEDPRNVEKIDDMVREIMPELQKLRPREYIS